MQPEEINKAHGKPTWTCWGCNTDKGLHWYFGLSVSVCSKPECSAAYRAMCEKQLEESEQFEQYCKDYFE